MSKRLRGFLVAFLGLAALVVLGLMLVAVFGPQGGVPVAQGPHPAGTTPQPTNMAYPPPPPTPVPTQPPTLLPTVTPGAPPQTAPATFTPTPPRQAGEGYLNQRKVTDLQWLPLYYPAVFLAEVVRVQPGRWANPENKRPENWGHPELGWTPEQGGGWPFTPVELKVIEWLKLPQLTKEQEAAGVFALDEAARMRANPPSTVTLDALWFGRIVGKENTLGGQGWPELREGDWAIFTCSGPYKYISGDLLMVTFHCTHAFPVTSGGIVTDRYGNALSLEEVRSLIQKALQGEISP